MDPLAFLRHSSGIPSQRIAICFQKQEIQPAIYASTFCPLLGRCADFSLLVMLCTRLAISIFPSAVPGQEMKAIVSVWEPYVWYWAHHRPHALQTAQTAFLSHENRRRVPGERGMLWERALQGAQLESDGLCGHQFRGYLSEPPHMSGAVCISVGSSSSEAGSLPVPLLGHSKEFFCACVCRHFVKLAKPQASRPTWTAWHHRGSSVCQVSRLWRCCQSFFPK